MPRGVNQYTRATGGPFTGHRGTYPSHGLSRTSTYAIWQTMKARCENPRHNRFKHYGGRGITVCERWRDFKNFLADMGVRPAKMTLDRRDSSGHYEPGNCRWATQKTQQRNRTNNRHLTAFGLTLTVAEWAEMTRLSKTKITQRLDRGWSTERSLVIR
jgi:hypothetical protein